MDAVYKIRRDDGLFSNGGHVPRFTKNGKIWKTLGHLKRHLKEMDFDRARYSYANCQIIEYVESQPIPIHTIINEAQERSEELSRRREERRERQRIERLEREFELKKEELRALKMKLKK